MLKDAIEPDGQFSPDHRRPAACLTMLCLILGGLAIAGDLVGSAGEAGQAASRPSASRAAQTSPFSVVESTISDLRLALEQCIYHR